jgi:hypothetical protein
VFSPGLQKAPICAPSEVPVVVVFALAVPRLGADTATHPA